MALWTDAAPADCAELFRGEYARLQASHDTLIADTLDRAAYFRITARSVFSATDRLLAICHMAAHMLEEVPANGQNARSGGPLTAKSSERGSASYATVPVGVYFGVADHLLQGTAGGRNLLAMIAAHPAISAVTR